MYNIDKQIVAHAAKIVKKQTTSNNNCYNV